MVRQEEWERIYKLIDSGMSVPNVAIVVGRSAPTIYRLVALGGPKKAKLNASTKLANFEEYLNKRTSDGVTNLHKLFSEIKTKGYHGSYSSLVRHLKDKEHVLNGYKPAKRFETESGEQAQVDWGSFGRIFVNGKKERLYCFVYVLGFSRAMHIEFTVRQNLQTLLECHIHAFSALGIPETIVYDNMKTVVLERIKQKSGKNRIIYHPGLIEFAKYYGFAPRAHSPYWPRSKGKVEAGVKYVRNNFMQDFQYNRRSLSLDLLNEKACDWLESTANSRIHGTTKQKPFELWLKEKSHLKFPHEHPPYQTSIFLPRNSTKDGSIQYKSNFYSVPIKYARRQLLVREVSESGVAKLEIYFKNRLVAKHFISTEKYKYIFDTEHQMEIEDKSVMNKNVKAVSGDKHVRQFARPLSYYSSLLPRAKNG